MASFGYVIEVIVDHLGLKIKSTLKLFAGILGLLILSSLLNSVKASFASSGISDAFSIMSSCAVFLTAIASEYAIMRSVADFFERLCIFVNSLLPLTASLYAMGGNVAGAVVHHSSLMIFITIIENFCTKSALPVSGICMSLSAVSSVLPNVNVGSLLKAFKKSYTQALGFFMTIFVTVIGAQSLLAGKSDTLAGKAAKFAVSNLIPTVGAALSGTLGTVAASVEYIRASIGIVGIMAVILMLIPTLITLLLTRLVFFLLEGAADILGASNEKRILSELSSINGFLLALASISSVSLIFIIAIFAKCSSAAGGAL
jgi:stage III sporulation protein AE